MIKYPIIPKEKRKTFKNKVQRDKYANKNKYWRNCFGIIINFYINTCVSLYIYI